MDTAVPLSKFADMVEFAVKTAAAFDLRSCISSHAGDGNLHLNIVGKMQDKAFATRLNQAYEKIVSHAIFQGGTATGEHGVGIGKRKFMRQQHGAGVDIMRGIKHLFDPNGILNPCKVLPAEDAS
jgi:D-lactate dehydrogenase (cytochrome)